MQRISALTFCASIFTLALPLLVGGCSPSLGSSESDGETGDGDSNGEGEGDGGFDLICSDAEPCPDGQYCFNGVCAFGCTNDGHCADNQYCDTEWDMLCKNKEVPTCASDDDCAASQICVNEYCSTPPPDTSCDPSNIAMDGCESDALCLQDFETETTACYTMPPCAEDNTCPAGSQGAVCNTDYLPQKDAICLLGACDSAADCPSDWFCVRFTANDPLGFCSGGGLGEPCTSDAECLSENCMIAAPGFPGFCQ